VISRFYIMQELANRAYELVEKYRSSLSAKRSTMKKYGPLKGIAL
jgi:hypothetical protein